MVTLNDQRVEQLQVKIDDLTKLLADQEKVEKNLFGRMANLHLDINTYEKDLVYVNAKVFYKLLSSFFIGSYVIICEYEYIIHDIGIPGYFRQTNLIYLHIYLFNFFFGIKH